MRPSSLVLRALSCGRCYSQLQPSSGHGGINAAAAASPPRPSKLPYRHHLPSAALGLAGQRASISTAGSGPAGNGASSQPQPEPDPQTQAIEAEEQAKDTRPLPLPDPRDTASASTTADGAPAPTHRHRLVVDDAEGVRLDDLGPLVVNRDGTASRVANWDRMTPAERETTVRVLRRRNAARIAALRAQDGEGVGERGE